MHLLNEKQFSSSEDEESEGESTADEPLDDSQIYDEENVDPGNINQSSAEEGSEEEISEKYSEDSYHPYPTPPPDADRNRLVQSVANKENNSKLANRTTQVRKGTILSQSLQAIKTMNQKSGSSVQAIVKFIKASGYETTDESRLPKLVLRSLKLALGKGEVVQVKRSFKLSLIAKKESKATEKMKLKQKKKVADAKDKAKTVSTKADAKPKANTKKKATATEDKTSNDKKKPLKKKPNERSTNQPTKEKANAGAAGGKAKMIQEDPAPVVDKESKKKKPKGKSTAKAPVMSPNIEVKSNGPRKSIATLVPTSAKPKVNVKSIKKLVAGAGNRGGIVSVNMDSEPVETPTLSLPTKKKRMAKQVK